MPSGSPFESCPYYLALPFKFDQVSYFTASWCGLPTIGLIIDFLTRNVTFSCLANLISILKFEIFWSRLFKPLGDYLLDCGYSLSIRMPGFWRCRGVPGMRSFIVFTEYHHWYFVIRKYFCVFQSFFSKITLRIAAIWC